MTDQNADVFNAIAHPVRREILDRLRQNGPSTVLTIAEGFTISRPAISQHLATLHTAGLVTSERQGRENIYSLHPEPLSHVYHWLQYYAVFWSGKLDALDNFLNEESDET